MQAGRAQTDDLRLHSVFDEAFRKLVSGDTNQGDGQSDDQEQHS